MPPEVLVLGLAVLWQGVQVALMAVPANRELGAGKTLSPRDPDRLGRPLMEQVSPVTGRLHRAMTNHFEALAMFTPAVLVVVWSGGGSWLTALLAWVYLAARIVYVPAYSFGWVPWRSILWSVGFLATMGMVAAALITAWIAPPM